MKKKRMILILFCVSFTVLLFACNKRTDVKEGDSFIYCLDEDRTGLVKVTYSMEEDEPLDLAQAVLKELKRPAEEIAYTTVLPKDVEVQSCELKGSIL